MKAETSLKVLIVLQDEDTLKRAKSYLPEEYSPDVSETAEMAVRHLAENDYDLIILDGAMQSDDEGSLLHYIYHNYEECSILIVSGEGGVQDAVLALRSGADDYLTTPLDKQEFIESVRRFERLAEVQTKFNDDIEADAYHFNGLIGESDSMQRVYTSIVKAAHVHETVLITGESGTGKDVVARAIHEVSGIPGDFIPVNCGAIPPDLLESELFGHTKGSYTGALSSEDGFFQAAHNGTLFLDEVANTSPAMQAKLLRVLENTQVWKVGSRQPDPINVRVIAATNVDLKIRVDQNKFRDDLYYRLNVIRIPLPPLRDRGDDVVLLTKYFVEKFSSEMGVDPPQMTPEVLQEFQKNDWPGNVRQLQNTIKRLLIKDLKVVTNRDLPELFNDELGLNFNESRSLEDIETEHILRVLEQTNWNKTQAAIILGITRKTLLSKIRRRDLNKKS